MLTVCYLWRTRSVCKHPLTMFTTLLVDSLHSLSFSPTFFIVTRGNCEQDPADVSSGEARIHDQEGWQCHLWSWRADWHREAL